jgi:Mrp family chromosome partitioning ATPase
MKRPWRLLLAGGAIFLGVMLSYLLLPAGAQGVRNLIRGDQSELRDTTLLALRERNARRHLAAADSALALTRSVNASLLARDSEKAAMIAPGSVGDSSLAEVRNLRDLIKRADNAPLPASYRAMARSPELRGDRRVTALVDSMTMIERERDELGGGATVDPVFVALTTQANEIGRRISDIAKVRLASLEREQAARQGAANQGAAADSTVAVVDSMPVIQARESAWQAYESAHRSLAAARAANSAATTAAAQVRAGIQLAPLPILIAGALILASVFAFGLSFLDEMRSPRVADAAEAERLTELRVLGVARQRAVPGERNRRAADRTVPPSLDPTFDAYRVVAWHLSSQWPKDGIVTVTGDHPMVSATVAANLAAVMANDARVTLLIDADLAAEPVRTVLSLPRSPGLAAVLENRRKWSESLVSVPVGRGRTLDILPAGGRPAPLGPAESQALIGELQRAARRHDVTIVVAPLSMSKRFRAGDDVVVCATLTRTRLSTLARTVASLIDEGARVRGVVLWEGALPVARGDAAAAAAPAA